MALSRSSALAEPMLKRAEEADFIRAWQADGDVAARDAVVRAYARLCYKIASQYSSNPAHVDDLAQEGTYGLMRALDRYDASRGVKFSTYSRYWIQNFVAAASSKTINVISVPSRAFIDARMGRLQDGSNEAAVAASKPSVALDAPIGEDGGGGSLIDMLACPRPNPEEAAALATAQHSMGALIGAAMDFLSERERAVIVGRRLSDPARTLEEISEDYGVTRERIRQIEVGALLKLRNYLIGNGFEAADYFRD